MKQLVCEMCGSKDLIKTEGLFVCQQCGCKYTVEEARKMMIEGTVDVSGSSVKIDKSEEAEKLLALGRRAYRESNYERASSYFDDALKVDPDSWEANFYRSYCSTMTCKLINLVSQFQATVNAAASSLNIIYSKENVEVEGIIDIINRIKELSTLAFFNKYSFYNQHPEKVEYLGSGNSITHNENGYRDMMLGCTLMAGAVSKLYIAIPMNPKANSHVADAAFSAAQKLESDLRSSPEAPYNQFGYRHIYQTYMNVRNDLISFAKDAQDSIIKSKKGIEARENIKRRAEEQKYELEKAERVKKYWDAHIEEKNELQKKLDELNTQLEQINEKIDPIEARKKEIIQYRDESIPAENKKEALLKEKKDLMVQYQSLGILKVKEKKTINERIGKIWDELKTLDAAIDQEKEERRVKAKKEIKEIENQLKPYTDQRGEIMGQIEKYRHELEKDRKDE